MKCQRTVSLLIALSCLIVLFAGFGVSATESTADLTNRYDSSKATLGHPKASVKDDGVNNDNNYYASETISVSEGDVITFGPCLVDQGYFLMAYDAAGVNGTQIKLENCKKVDTVLGNAVILQWTVPSGKAYIRMATSQMFVDSTLITVNQPFDKTGYYAEMDRAGVNIDYVRPTAASGTLTNLFPVSDKTYAGYVSADASEKPSEYYRTSDYIPVKEGDILYLAASEKSQGHHLALMNADKVGVGTVNYKYMVEYEDIERGYAIYSYRVKSGVSYVRVCASTGVYVDGIELVTCNQPFTGADYRDLFHITLDVSDTSTSILNGHTALFMGDSISYGAHDTNSYLREGKSWAGRIAANTGLIATNASVGGARVGYSDSYGAYGTELWLFTQYEAHKNEDFDMVVMHGGVNDAGEKRTVGRINDVDSDTSVLLSNVATYAGGLQWLFHNVKETWPDATLFFIANHHLDGNTAGYRSDMSAYFTVAEQLCKLYGVIFIDCYNNQELNDKLETTTTKYLPDKLHLNPEGYAIITPYIQSALEEGMKAADVPTDGPSDDTIGENTEESTTSAPAPSDAPNGSDTEPTGGTAPASGGCNSGIRAGLALTVLVSLAGVSLLRKKH